VRVLAAPDATQSAILPQLEATERLLARGASLASGRDEDAEIVVMPDLGLPHNVRRIRGGFFTGAYYRWSGDTPFIPVDATVNVCGVGLYRVSLPDEDDTVFRERVGKAMVTADGVTTYVPNFASGNHFVLLVDVAAGQQGLDPGRYLVLHASSAEFKKQFNGLYPAPNNWYSDQVRTIEGEGHRYLRYISGSTAETFARRAAMLVDYQRDRMRTFADLIAGPGGVEDEILSVPHYGMPDRNSIAIGCQWMDPARPNYVLLTRPKAPVYLVRAREGGQNAVTTEQGERLLTPHGLGVKSTSPLTLSYGENSIEVNGKPFTLDASLAEEDLVAIRDFHGQETVQSTLAHTPGDILAELTQIAAYHRNGEK